MTQSIKLSKSSFKRPLNWNDYFVNHGVRYNQLGTHNILIEQV